MKIAILTTKNQWFEPYADALSEKLGNIPIFNNHVDIKSNYDVIFVLSYHEIIKKWMYRKMKFLERRILVLSMSFNFQNLNNIWL
jgi:methionyl-tRNA formyltransferase